MIADLKHGDLLAQLPQLSITVISTLCTLVILFSCFRNRSYSIPSGKFILVIFLTNFIFHFTSLFLPIDREPTTFFSYVLAFSRLNSYLLSLAYPACKGALLYFTSTLSESFSPRRFAIVSIFGAWVVALGLSLICVIVSKGAYINTPFWCYTNYSEGNRIARGLFSLSLVWIPAIVSFIVSIVSHYFAFWNLKNLPGMYVKLSSQLSFPAIIYFVFLLPNLLPLYAQAPGIRVACYLLTHSLGLLNFFVYRGQTKMKSEEEITAGMEESSYLNESQYSFLNESMACLTQSTNYSLNYSGLRDSIIKKQK